MSPAIRTQNRARHNVRLRRAVALILAVVTLTRYSPGRKFLVIPMPPPVPTYYYCGSGGVVQ